jgi:UDP-glucose 4-epimerase
MVKSLVTGGAGFIGSHLVDELIGLGHEVTVIDNLSNGQEKYVNKKAKFFNKNICEDLSEIFSGGFDYVFHLAAQINLRTSLENPKKDAEVNVVGSLNLIKESVNYGVKKFVFSSSGGAIYSKDAGLPCDENSKEEPLSPYGLGKLTIEKYLEIFKKIKGLDYVCLRYSNVYGPRQNHKSEAGVISIFANSALEGKPLNIFGSGENTRDFIYVKDVVNANVKAMELTGIYNVSTNDEKSVNEIAEKIKELISSESEVVHKPEINGELAKSRLSCDKLGEVGWKPEVDIETGLKQTVDFFRN